MHCNNVVVKLLWKSAVVYFIVIIFTLSNGLCSLLCGSLKKSVSISQEHSNKLQNINHTKRYIYFQCFPITILFFVISFKSNFFLSFSNIMALVIAESTSTKTNELFTLRMCYFKERSVIPYSTIQFISV